MGTKINETAFGSITVDGVTYDHDIRLRLDGEVKKRKKKLSKEIYGTGHILSLAEAEDVYENGAVYLLIGSGQEGMLKLSPEAKEFFEKKHCKVELLPTPQAAERWNARSEPGIALFHITC